MAKMKPSDPAYWMLFDEFTSTPNPDVYRDYCYICRDPEYAQMGLPLCYACEACGGHVAVDASVCDDCGADQQDLCYQRKAKEAPGTSDK